jgi:hypothetical protein
MMNTYENAPSYNRGDQGFINYYFNQSAHPLPGNYNLMIKFTVSFIIIYDVLQNFIYPNIIILLLAFFSACL